MTDPSQDRRDRITIRRFDSAADADAEDLAFWRRLSDAERVRLVWQLSVEQFRLAGEELREPGLCRSVARVRRS